MRKIALLIFLFSVPPIRTVCQVDSLKVNQQFYEVKKMTDSLQIQVAQLIETKKNFSFWDKTPWVLTFITILVSIMVYKRDVSYRNVSFVTESNKMKIADPSLWAFYDSYIKDFNTDIVISKGDYQINGVQDFVANSEGDLTATGTGELSLNGKVINKNDYANIKVTCNDHLKTNGSFTLSLPEQVSLNLRGSESKKLEGKIRAYCYFKLNSFELVFNHNKIIGTSNKVWEDYMINSMIGSTYFYGITKKESEGYLYNKEYRQKLSDFLIIAQLCRSKESDEINKIIESKERLILAHRSGLIQPTSDLESLERYLN